MAKALGLAGLGLTDHDTLAGGEELAAAGVALGLPVYLGVEISCKEAGGRQLHLLGYAIPPEGRQAVEAFCRPIREGRDQAVLRAARAPGAGGLSYLRAAAAGPGGAPGPAVQAVPHGTAAGGRALPGALRPPCISGCSKPGRRGELPSPPWTSLWRTRKRPSAVSQRLGAGRCWPIPASTAIMRRSPRLVEAGLWGHRGLPPQAQPRGCGPLSAAGPAVWAGGHRRLGLSRPLGGGGDPGRDRRSPPTLLTGGKIC